jgi:hypothetical protein
MNGMTSVSVDIAGSFNPGPSWQIRGTGDFNGDGVAGSGLVMSGTGASFVGALGSFYPGARLARYRLAVQGGTTAAPIGSATCPLASGLVGMGLAHFNTQSHVIDKWLALATKMAHIALSAGCA